MHLIDLKESCLSFCRELSDYLQKEKEGVKASGNRTTRTPRTPRTVRFLRLRLLVQLKLLEPFPYSSF